MLAWTSSEVTLRRRPPYSVLLVFFLTTLFVAAFVICELFLGLLDLLDRFFLEAGFFFPLAIVATLELLGVEAFLRDPLRLLLRCAFFVGSGNMRTYLFYPYLIPGISFE